MVEKLVAYLKKCDDAYYNSDSVLVSNDTYDALVETLRRLSPAHPYLSKVGSPLREGTSKVGRLVPMGTLSKYHTEDSVREWLQREEGSILLAPKYDGFGVELTYQNGFLTMASTRGDGHVGEDVLEAVMRIPNIPIKLPEGMGDLRVVRGEAIIPRKYHEDVKKLGYSAMRNAVPGIVRSNRADALRFVEFVAYEFFDNYLDRNIQRERYQELFTVEEYKLFDSEDFENILSYRNKFGIHKEDYVYEFDGVVLKTIEIKEDDLLCPKHQIAWKFKSNRETTTLRGIEFNVGATGSISVIGIFDEVEFQGAKLKRASFGSLPLYRKMKPSIGDLIEVSRRGDIIPWIEGIVYKNSEEYSECIECPCCGTPLKDDKCPNKYCPERVKLKLYQYVKSIGVKGIGYSLLVSLVDAGIIKELSDIYTMDVERILSLPRQGNSSVEKWRKLQSKEITSFELLCAYPFENAGKSLWKSLLERYSMEEILNLDEETLLSANIKGIGTSKIKSIISQLTDSKEEIMRLVNVLNLK